MDQQPPKPDAAKPPPLPYASRTDSHRPKAFGSFFGNVAVGFVALLAAGFIGYFLMQKFPGQGQSIYLLPAYITLVLGIIAACFARYRGILTGMLSAIVLIFVIVVGLALLLVGLCFSGKINGL